MVHDLLVNRRTLGNSSGAKDCTVVSDRMLISIISIFIEPLEKLCTEVVDALAPWDGNLNIFLVPCI